MWVLSVLEADRGEQRAKSPNGETFFWMGPNDPLESLENPERIAQIKENHQKVLERFEKKKARERKRRMGIHAMIDDSMIIETLNMDEMYDLSEGAGACITCYK